MKSADGILSKRILLGVQSGEDASYITRPHFVSNVLRELSHLKMSLPARFWWPLIAVFVAGCGPPLSEPSSHNISGTWISSAHIGPLSDMRAHITQQPDGKLQGGWSAKVSPPDAPCPPGLGANPTGPVNGTNTVLEIRFSMLGAGDFEGQAVDDHTLRGSFTSCGGVFPITFTSSFVPAGS